MSPSKSRRFAPLPFLLILILLLAGPAFAGDRPWVVVSASGAVAVTGGEGGERALEARSGARLLTPFSVRTGHDGQLVIARDKDIMTIGPGARIDVPAPAEGGQGAVTRIRQALGSVLYQVEHKLKEAFEVHTPYLVSVVKGTTFNILVTADSSTVALIEGLLQVYTPDGKYESFLDAGQVAVMTADGDGIRIEDQRALSEPVAGPVRIGRANDLPAATIADPARSVERLATKLTDAATHDNGDTRLVSGLSADVEGTTLLGVKANDSSLQLGGVTLSDDGLIGIGVEESSVTLGGVSVGETALTPSIEVGDLSASLGGASLAIGSDLGIGLEVGDTSLALGGASIGETALTPSLDVGGISANLGGIDLGLGSDLNTSLDLGDTSLNLGGATLGETALTPGIGLGDTSLNIGDSGINLSTELDLGLLDPVALNVGIEVEPVTEIVTGTVNTVTDVVTDTTTTVLDTLTGRLRLF